MSNERAPHRSEEIPDEEIEAASPHTKQTSVAKSAGVVSVAVMGSRLLGLVREMLFAAIFGAGFIADAFQAAFKISNTLRDLFAEGSLSSAFVKVFTDYQVNRSEKDAMRLAALVLNALVVVLAVVVIAGIFLAPYVISLLAKDFSPEKAALATLLAQIMFPFILLVAMAALAMGVLNTKGHYAIPASASTAFNVFSIVFGLGLAWVLSGGQMAGRPGDINAVPPLYAQWAIIGMAIGVLIGGAAQFLIQVPSLWKVGFRFGTSISFRDEGVLQVAKLMAPATLGVSAVQIKVFIDVFLLSSIEGGNSWLPYAFRLMQFPIGVFGVAVATATIPVISRYAAEKRIDDYRSTLSSSIRLIIFLTLPAACGLTVLSMPIIRLIYERGLFSAVSTEMTAFALIGYAVGLTGYAAVKVLSPAFYSLDDVKTPMMVSLVSVLVYPFAGYFLMQVFSGFYVTPESPKGLAHVGLTVATSVIALISVTLLMWRMRRRIRRIDGRNIFWAFVRIALASAVMSAVCWISYSLLHSRFGAANFAYKLVECFVPIGLGGVTFLAAAKLLRVEEVEKAVSMVRRRLGR